MGALDPLLLGNALRRWLVLLAVAVIAHLLIVLMRRSVLSRLEQLAKDSATKVDDVLVAALKRTGYLTSVGIALYGASALLYLPGAGAEHLRRAAIVAWLVQIGAWLFAATGAAIAAWSPDRDGRGADATMTAGIGALLKVAIGAVLGLMILANLGVEVATLIAGLGVGGLAAALAVRTALGDVFASICIYFDRPFDIGDLVVVGNEQGTVERIGLRSTRIRALSGEQLIFANEDLASSRIRNFQRLEERRVLIHFEVRYETSHEQLQAIPMRVREVLEAIEGTRFDRCHLESYADSGLGFELVFYVPSNDYLAYMDARQQVLLGIHGSLETQGVRFALPTRTVHLEGEPGVIGSRSS